MINVRRCPDACCIHGIYLCQKQGDIACCTAPVTTVHFGLAGHRGVTLTGSLCRKWLTRARGNQQTEPGEHYVKMHHWQWTGNGASHTASQAHRGARNDTLPVIQVNVTTEARKYTTAINELPKWPPGGIANFDSRGEAGPLEASKGQDFEFW